MELVAQVQASEYGAMLVVYGFIAGVIVTTLPLIVGFLLAKRAFKLQLLNNLGSLTGGMTSTPALGTLVAVSGTDDVAAAYAATYPVALVLIVLASNLISTFIPEHPNSKPPAPTGAGVFLFRWFFRFSRGFCRRRC